MNRLIYDIETVGEPFESLDEKRQKHLLRWAKSEEDKEIIKLQTPLYALTGKVVSIALLNPDSGRARVYTIGKHNNVHEDDTEFFFVPDERKLLSEFWDDAREYNQFITFNGRTFDAPFLLLRSAVNRIKPTVDIMGYRYKSTPHLDLADQMSFFGATRRHFPLHFYCKAFGIESPKDNGMDGLDVPSYFHSGRAMEIAGYCLGDVEATAELLEYWDNFLDLDRINE